MNFQENVATTQPVAPIQSTGNPMKIGKFKASRMIVRESWSVFKQDKELAWFPVFTAITSLLALVVMCAVFFFVVMSGDIYFFDKVDDRSAEGVGYVILFVYYLVMFFITNYFLSGIYTIVHGRFNGQDLSLGDGISGANSHIGKIFIWSFISATVGVVLRIISDKSKLIGKIVSALFGAAWGILTYFSLPSLVIGQRSVKESFKESASVIRKTWGETIIVNFGVGLFFGLLVFLSFALAIGLLILVPVTEMFILVGILLVLFIIAVIIVSSTLGSIFKLALYEFALTGKVPNGFTPELIQGAVKGGK